MTIFTYRFAFYPLSSQGTGSNSRTTAKGFELGIHNLPSLIHLDLGGKNNRTHQFIISIVSELQTVFRLYNECTVKKKPHTNCVEIKWLFLWDKEFIWKKCNRAMKNGLNRSSLVTIIFLGVIKLVICWMFFKIIIELSCYKLYIVCGLLHLLGS